MTRFAYLRIFSDPQGCSHFETQTTDLESKNYAPPGRSGCRAMASNRYY
jgi:hypothetical protein